MSRQRAGWGISRFLNSKPQPKSPTAGKSKYEPHQGEGEKTRRRKQLEKLVEKANKRKSEVGGS